MVRERRGIDQEETEGDSDTQPRTSSRKRRPPVRLAYGPTMSGVVVEKNTDSNTKTLKKIMKMLTKLMNLRQ